MTLILEITSPSGRMSAAPGRQVFSEDGGSIGRAAGNTWVLSHNKVSGQHAVITCRDGVFYIQDMSRNGVSLNSPDNRLTSHRPYPLKSGDRLFIEPYEIDVAIDNADRVLPRPVRAAFDDEADPFAARAAAPVAAPGSDRVDMTGGGEVDPLQFFDPVEGSAPSRPAEPARGSMTDDLLNAHFGPPPPHSNPTPTPPDPGGIPHGYNPLAPDDSFAGAVPAPRPRPPEPIPSRPRPKESLPAEAPGVLPTSRPVRVRPEPASRAAAAVPPVGDRRTPEAAGVTDFADLLAAAGLPGANVTTELTRDFGEILRVVVAGLMDVLQSRQRIKEEFRMRQTTFRPVDNNPLKFSANVDDALHNLLVKRNAAYLGPVAAFADAFDDLRDHQLAMLAGMRAAFDTMVAQFDPDRLQAQFDHQLGKVSLPLLPAKLRYWDLYRDSCDELRNDPDAAFARLFGEEFARAYEAQFRTLKARRRGGAVEPAEDAPPLTGE